MAVHDIQNLIGRSFETQAIYQQAISQAELQNRRAERRQAEEVAEQAFQVNAGVAAEASDPLDLDLEKREAHAVLERLRRYRLALRPGGAQAEWMAPEAYLPGQRINLII